MVFRLLIILFSFTILSSCGDSDESQQENLILSANIAMGSGDCDGAISLMTSITTPTDNADFIKTLALSYACKAKFNATTFITTDLSKFGSDGTFNGTTLFTTSDDMTSITDDDWVYLLRAMNTILYAGGLSTEEDPTSSLRLQKFSQDDLNELEMVLVYLQLVSIGRFFHYHGEANSVGEKKDCLIQYENVGLNGGTNLQLLLQADTDSLTGSCTDANFTTAGVGSSDFGTPGDYNIAKLCEGAMLMNNFLHVFPSLLANLRK